MAVLMEVLRGVSRHFNGYSWIESQNISSSHPPSSVTVSQSRS